MNNTEPIQQIEHVCKNCGAQLDQKDQDTLKCSYCGTEVTLVSTPYVSSENQGEQLTDYSQYDQAREARQMAQEHQPAYLQKSSINSDDINKSTGFVSVGLTYGLVLWFVYYVIRACYDHTNFALSSTYYNNIFISKMGGVLWVVRGGALIVICTVFFYKKLRKRT